MGMGDRNGWAAIRLISRMNRMRRHGALGDVCVDAVIERWERRGTTEAAVGRLGRMPR